jgi:predicted dehydrogenase
MRLGFVGAGFVADYYGATLGLHPELSVAAVCDHAASRATSFAERFGGRVVADVDAMVSADDVDLVVNLTDPRTHLSVSMAAIAAGKHVYSEKPLAMAFDDAAALAAAADEAGVVLACAPCSVLGETAQTMGAALHAGVVGTPRVVYAEMDDGLVPAAPYRRWASASGLPWPYKDEFEVGCTIEHAAYVLSWLVAWFGPASKVVSYAAVTVPDKIPGETLGMVSPDFSVACIEWPSGVVARLTTGIVAPHDHSLTVVGDRGILYTDETWDYRAKVHSKRLLTIRRRMMLTPVARRHRLVDLGFEAPDTKGAQTMDFCRGPAEVAASIREGRACRIGSAFSLHVNELVLAIHDSLDGPNVIEPTTTFPTDLHP